MLKYRVLTALVLIPLTLAVLFYAPPPAFCILTALISLGAAWEWTNLMQLKSNTARWLYLGIMLIFMIYTAIAIAIPYLLLFSFIWWMFTIYLIYFYPRKAKWWHKNVIYRGLMGIFVIIPCWAAINFIRIQDDGVYALLYLFVLIWGADSAAYFIGKKWGRTKLAPAVSPGKTLQGLIGAIVASIIIAILAAWLGKLPKETWAWGLFLSLLTVLFSIVGDLFESMLKREAGLKDSGKLLPGHGGLLDRIDSLTAAAPIFALGGLVLSALIS